MLKPEFTDANGRKWCLKITIAHVKPLKEAGFDLKAVRDSTDAFDALADPETFGHVFYLLCEAQAEKLGVSPEEFMSGFDGATIHAASNALLAAVADFTHPPAVAKLVKERLPGMLADADAKAVELVNAAPA
ncbi:unnamed protein product [Gemmataceae bacterium]|nr:unnamed protein product [Gemmataceae bacterium]VTT99067.1 unnamed protein product [Gemmataceae bacterium]